MPIENPLNSSLLTFPILECIHIVGFAFSVGTVALVDFRLIGIGMTDHSPAKLWKDTFTWTLWGLLAVVLSGLLLFSTDPDNYYLNYAFLLKMAFFDDRRGLQLHSCEEDGHGSRRAAWEKGGRDLGLVLWPCVALRGFSGQYCCRLSILTGSENSYR